MSAQKEAKDPPSFTSFNPAEASTSKPPSFSSFNPPGPSSSNRPPTFSSFSPAAPPSRISRDQEEKGDGLREKGKGKEQEKERRLDGFERKEHRRRRHDRHDRGKDHSSHHRKRHEPDQEDHEERRKERRNHRNGDGRDDETIDLTETSSSRSRQHDSISYLRQESNQHLSSYHRRSDSRHHRPYRDRSEESVVRPISNSTFGIPSNHLNHGCGALSLNLKPTTAPPSYERDLYYTDLIGDDKAAKFGQDFSKVPRSHRAGGGRVLGLDEGLRITLESAKGRKGKGLMLAPGGKQRHRYVSSSQAWRTFERPQKRVRVGSKPGLIGIETWTDYIELRTRKPKTQGHESGPRHRVSLDLFPEDEEESASDASILGESEEDTDTFEDPYDQVRRKSRELNSRVLQDPQDTAAWLELVELQESIIESGGQEKIDILPRKMSRRSRRREAELAEEALKKTRATRRKALAAIQLSVLDRALGQFTASQPVELVLARLRTAASSGLWDSERLQKEWNKILETDRRENHNHLEESILLWSEYLEWRASDWSLFEFMAVWKEFARGVAAMGSRASMFSYECAERSKCEQAQIQIASMACKLAREAGFVEWGIAVSQALLELNSSRPEGLSEPPFQPSVLERDYASSSEQEMAWIEKVLDSLQSFWDKEGLRLGEEGASGWDVASSQPESDPFNVERPPPEYEKAFSDEPIPKDPFERWRSTELSRSKTRSLPARTTDKPLWKASEEEIDPDSIVFFSDIRPLLFVVHCQNSKVALLDLSLEAAGLPSNLVSSLSHNATGPATKHHSVSLELSDQFWPEELRDLSRNKFDLPMSSESIEGLRMERERKSFLADPSRCPIKSWPVTLENIFSNPGVSPLSQDVSCALHSSTPANHRFARRILDQVGRRINHVSIQLLRLGLEAHVSLKLAIKLAKKILSDDRQNLVLWNAYAELEKKAGKVESARTVYLTTLESLSGLGENGIKEAPAIWAALSELEWKQGRPDQALGVLMLAASSRLHTTLSVGNKLKEILGNDFKISDVAIRQTREDFASINSQMHFSFGPKQLPKVVFCLALFEHLIQPAGSGISAACKVFESKAKIFESKDAENGTRVAEDILTHEVRFIRHHVDSKGSFRPSDARRALTAAVEAAPSNTEFFSNLAANEMRSKVENYLRLTLERVTLGDRREARRTLIRRQPEEEAVRWLYAVYVELNLHTTSFNEHSVRRIFEQAVEAEGARHSAHIWKAFIDFECRLHTFRDGSGSERERKTHLLRAKSLVYRAIHNCPSCKDLYMVAFSRPLRSVMKSDELRMMFEMMCEKGLRQFVHLEDFLEDWEREEEEEEDAMSEDDASGSVGDGGVRQMKRQRQPADSDDSDFEDGVLKEGRKRKAIYEQVGGGEPPHLESPAGDRSSSAAGLEIEAKGSVPMCYYEEPPPKASLETLPIEVGNNLSNRTPSRLGDDR
ncbi:hypothetical protein IE53DRAFT_224556 [Violaceomyces palustris]|uniref:Uncharacterized protein n=1 Tax=Violaceomyces palustris TaxID=1673888 RepID=A0ACD0P4I4_9BASI|nr:hypothetical protein IE53DRAFT_224556 [Violaceomyces palustris]